MADQLIIGIDPGKSGGIAFMFPDGPVIKPLPATNHDLIDLWQDYLGVDEWSPFVYMEKVQTYAGSGSSASSGFTFGVSYGALQMLLSCKMVPFELIRPQVWQSALGCLSAGDKNVTKRRAQELFPGLKITHATADALLIGEYGRRLRNGGI